MKPANAPTDSNASKLIPPAVSCPIDTEDYFELAWEADEFGIRLPEPVAAE
jgi:hypothetical protein